MIPKEPKEALTATEEAVRNANILLASQSTQDWIKLKNMGKFLLIDKMKRVIRNPLQALKTLILKILLPCEVIQLSFISPNPNQ